MPDEDIVGSAVAGAPRLPLLVLDVVERYLDENGIGKGDVRARRIGEGSSNATFLLTRGGEQFVLRRPPRPPLPPSAHDVVREARLQRALAHQRVPVPRILAVEESGALLGVPFYISDFIPGDVLTRTLTPLLEEERERRRVTQSLVDTLAQIHGVDVQTPALAAFVRPGDFLERQVMRFTELWQHNATREIPAVEEVASWLALTRPDPVAPTVVHGDYRLGNVMVTRDSPARVAVVLDWEMGTIGDPRADLGYLVATYSDTAAPRSVLELSPVTALPGFLDRSELVDRYEAATGRDLGDLTWFETLALWKAAVFCEAIFRRYTAGELSHDRFAARLREGVPQLAEAALLASSAS